MRKSEIINRLNSIKDIDIATSNNINCSKEFRKDAESDAIAVDIAINCVKSDKSRTEQFYKGIGISSVCWILLLLSIGIWRLI